MKYFVILFLLIASIQKVLSQCSVCARTTEQLNPSAAEGFNFGVLYLMSAPLLIMGGIGYMWYKRSRHQ